MIVLQKRRVRYHRPALPQGVRQRRWHMTRGTHRSHDCGLPVELSRTSQHLIKNKIQQMQQRRRWPKSRHRQPGWAAFGDEVARAPEPNRKKMNIPNLHQPGRPSKKTEGLCRHIVSKPNGNSQKKKFVTAAKAIVSPAKGPSRASSCHLQGAMLPQGTPLPLGPTDFCSAIHSTCPPLWWPARRDDGRRARRQTEKESE